jgi:hypothetical protein
MLFYLLIGKNGALKKVMEPWIPYPYVLSY